MDDEFNISRTSTHASIDTGISIPKITTLNKPNSFYFGDDSNESPLTRNVIAGRSNHRISVERNTKMRHFATHRHRHFRCYDIWQGYHESFLLPNLAIPNSQQFLTHDCLVRNDYRSSQNLAYAALRDT